MMIIKTNSGNVWAVPHLVQLQIAHDDDCGFCAKCGFEVDAIEPDAEYLECEMCGEKGVFGAAEFGLRGWYYTNKDDYKFADFEIIG